MTFHRTRSDNASEVASSPPMRTASSATGLVSMNTGMSDIQRQTSVNIIITVRTLKIGWVKLTEHASRCYGASRYVGDCEFLVDPTAHIRSITYVEGMPIWLARVKRGRASSEEQAENWEDREQTHEAGKAGRDANAQSGDETRIQPVY